MVGIIGAGKKRNSLWTPFQPIAKGYTVIFEKERMFKHHRALLDSRCKVDNRKPKKRPKTLVSQIEKKKKRIERKNEKIVQAMMHIMRKGGYVDNLLPPQPISTLNGIIRKHKMKQIAWENGRIHRTLLTAKSKVPTKPELEERWRFQKKLRKTLKMPPPVVVSAPPASRLHRRKWKMSEYYRSKSAGYVQTRHRRKKELLRLPAHDQRPRASISRTGDLSSQLAHGHNVPRRRCRSQGPMM